MRSAGGASEKQRKNRYSPEQVTDWQRSGLSKSEYARQNGVHPNVFARWVTRYTEEKLSDDFVMIDPHVKELVRQSTIEIILSEGILVKCASAAEAGEIIKQIRGL